MNVFQEVRRIFMNHPNGYTPRFSKDVYRELIAHAKTANPSPFQSGFYVRTAGMTLSGKFVVGGNNEYGITDAEHGEESVIDAAKQQFPGDPLVLVGFYNVGAGHCGNCRDRLKEAMLQEQRLFQQALKALTAF